MRLNRDIDSLSNFKRNTSHFLKQMKRTKRPVVLTVNGKAELVVQDANSYQELLEIKQRMDAVAVLRERLAGMKGNGRPAEEFFTEFFARQRISDE
jgi:prevent-host-death family protein